MDAGAYCRAIERYLCQRNGGHLIRIVGVAFERVCGWAESGVPLLVVTAGIDRKLARVEHTDRSSRPLRIEFCEADVLDAFDEWRRAVGVATTTTVGSTTGPSSDPRVTATPRHGSLPKHIDQVVTRVTSQLALPELAPGLHAALADTIDDLERVRASARTARGSSRAELIERLERMDQQLLAAVRSSSRVTLEEFESEAREALASFRTRLDETAYVKAVEASTDRLLRERLRLPTVRFDG